MRVTEDRSLELPGSNDVCWPVKRVCTATMVVCCSTYGVRRPTYSMCTPPTSACKGTNTASSLARVVCWATQTLRCSALGCRGPTNTVGGPTNIVGGPGRPLFSPHLLARRPYVTVLPAPLPLGEAPYREVWPANHVVPRIDADVFPGFPATRPCRLMPRPSCHGGRVLPATADQSVLSGTDSNRSTAPVAPGP